MRAIDCAVGRLGVAEGSMPVRDTDGQLLADERQVCLLILHAMSLTVDNAHQPVYMLHAWL